MARCGKCGEQTIGGLKALAPSISPPAGGGGNEKDGSEVNCE